MVSHFSSFDICSKNIFLAFFIDFSRNEIDSRIELLILTNLDDIEIKVYWETLKE